MQYTDFKDLKISRLGFGAMRLPMDAEGKIEPDHVQKMVDYALAHGINYFDTAYKYHAGESENYLGRALAKHPRESFFLADKMPSWLCAEESDVKKIFEEQLGKCGVEYFDFYLMHNVDEEGWDDIVKLHIFEHLKEEKEAGRIRHLGASFHCSAEFLDKVLSTYGDYIEFVQLQINYFDWESSSVQSRLCLEVANRHGVPVIVMEPVKGGGLADPIPEVKALLQQAGPGSPASWAIRFAASQPGVFMVLSGMSNPEQLRDNMRYMADFVPLTEAEQDLLLRCAGMIRATGAVQCTACQYCVEDCPKQINIPALFAVWNTAGSLAANNFPTMHYGRAVADRGRAGDCIACRACERHCPQHLPISDLMKQISAKFDK